MIAVNENREVAEIERILKTYGVKKYRIEREKVFEKEWVIYFEVKSVKDIINMCWASWELGRKGISVYYMPEGVDGL